ncbi:MAG: peptide/nickel transport system ATP-binding protein [Actinomycetota bacterium]|jgi:oligopeptide/dipeptide ABC transporter ATP-binding protein|nr:peptide/nickel transport system ATP-binding protein [Actinomycetota bacterium]
MTAPLLDLKQISLDLPIRGRLQRVIHDVTLTIVAGESVGLVGESGSGKSMTARTIMRLIKRGWVAGGTVTFEDENVYQMNARRLRQLRGSDIAMIYQDPRAHTNPVRTNGNSLLEGMLAQGVPRDAARERALDLLAEVGIPDGDRRMRQYPHELSGGLLQRIMIAAAVSLTPRLLLADEPTTALDVTTQEEVMAILDEQRTERGLAMLVISHDLDLAAAVTDRIAVMYAGVLLEVAPSQTLHQASRHPYTVGLLASRPVVGTRTRIRTIPGRPLSAFEVGPGCVFASRCPFVADICTTERPTLRPVGDHQVACHRAEDIESELADWAAESR